MYIHTLYNPVYNQDKSGFKWLYMERNRIKVRIYVVVSDYKGT